MMKLIRPNLSLFAYDPERDKDTNYAAQMQAIINNAGGEANLSQADLGRLAELERAANDKVNYLNQTGTNQWGAQTSTRYQNAYASASGSGFSGGNEGSGGGGRGGSAATGAGNDTHYTPPSTYQPLGGGTDWDRLHMNNHDYALLQSYGDAWTSANAAGNTELAQHYHDLAEELRAKYYYSGGVDGSQYIPQPMPEMQQWTLDDIMARLTDAVGASPTFHSRWDDTKMQLADAYLDMNYEDFLKSDQYQALANRYGLNGRNAMQNVLGQIASRTGGLASSYSSSVASQAYNDYMAQLEAAAYDMYGGELGNAYNKAMAAYGFDDSDYNKYLDDLAQWNREYSYAADALSQALQQSNYNQEWDYSVNQANKNDAMKRIDAFLSMGGSLADLDPNLISASGYTQAELQQLYNYYQMQLNPYGAGGGGGYQPRGRDSDPNPTPEAPVTSPGKDRMAILDNAYNAGNWKNDATFLNYATRNLGFDLDELEYWARRRKPDDQGRMFE